MYGVLLVFAEDQRHEHCNCKFQFCVTGAMEEIEEFEESEDYDVQVQTKIQLVNGRIDFDKAPKLAKRSLAVTLREDH